MLVPRDHVTGNVDTAKTPLERLMDKDDYDLIQMALASLPPRVERIVRLYCGFYGDNKGHNFREIGEQMGLSGNRIRQLFERGIRQLEHPAVTKVLRECVKQDRYSNYCHPSNLPARHYVPEWKRPILAHINKYRYRAYYDFDLRRFLQGKMSTKDLTEYFSSKEGMP
jgi:hypothetical protein